MIMVLNARFISGRIRKRFISYSRGLMILILLAILCLISFSAFAEDPIVVRMTLSKYSFSEPETISVLIDVENNGSQSIDSLSLFFPNGKQVEEFGSDTLEAGDHRSWEGEWSVTKAEIEAERLTFKIVFFEGEAQKKRTKNFSRDLIYEAVDEGVEDEEEVLNTPVPEKPINFVYQLQEDGTLQITGYIEDVENLIIPSHINGMAVTSIKELEAKVLNKIRSITIPETVIEINPYNFAAFTNNAEIVVSQYNPAFTSVDGVLYNKGKTILLSYPPAKNGLSFTIPEGVEEIEAGAFRLNKKLINVRFPKSIRKIGISAFANCEELRGMTIPDSVDLEYNIFEGSKKIEEVWVSPDHPTLAIIDGVLFNKNLKELIYYPFYPVRTSYTIPQGIRGIGINAFKNNTDLETIYFPDSVEYIHSCAFSGCEHLKSIELPPNIPVIELGVFEGCMELSNLVLPSNLKRIETSFFACLSLKELYIPETVEYINQFAFAFGSHDITLKVERSSYAAEFCRENEIRYSYPTELDWLND